MINLQAVFNNVKAAVKYHAKAITVVKGNKTEDTYKDEIQVIRGYLALLHTRIR